MGVGDQHHNPAAFTPEKDPVPIVQELEWASKPVWIPGFDPRTFKPVASRYTDYAIPTPCCIVIQRQMSVWYTRKKIQEVIDLPLTAQGVQETDNMSQGMTGTSDMSLLVKYKKTL